MKEKRLIKVIQKDYLENTETVIYDGMAEVIIDDDYTVNYQENDETSVSIKLNKTEGSLVRISEARTDINFHIQDKTEATLLSEYGRMIMDVITDEITLKHNNLMLGYTLKQNGSEVGKFLMKVKWDNE